jgi:glycosyltransferase involved in cell wall biosynthesis
MANQFSYIPQSSRKKILLLCDDIRMPSGVGTMGREIVVNTSHHFNWVNIGAMVEHPETGKIFDLSQEVNKLVNLNDSYVRVIPNNGYGTPDLLRQIIKLEQPDAVMIFTDPRYWIWLFEMEREIRSRIPIFYLNIWDDLPIPLYNKPYYESVDLLMAISKQTKLINELVLGDIAKEKVIEYVPHGVNENYFYPIKPKTKEYKEFLEFKSKLLPKKDIGFTVLFNSRNIRRKAPGDLILAYKLFCDKIGKDKASKCSLVMHTEIVSGAGTDLEAVRDAICDPSYVNIYFSTEKASVKQMNFLYNSVDAVILPSSNEGWGLSVTEGMMAGKMIIGNVTGGIQDQMRFVDNAGKWYTPSPEVPSNHRGTYKECGEWAIPVFPSVRTLIGSPLTPYIFDDHCSVEDLAEAIFKVYSLTPAQRDQKGMSGRQWVTSEESGMSATNMGKKVIYSIEKGFQNFKPRKNYDLLKIEERPLQTVSHKLTDY